MKFEVIEKSLGAAAGFLGETYCHGQLHNFSDHSILVCITGCICTLLPLALKFRCSLCYLVFVQSNPQELYSEVVVLQSAQSSCPFAVDEEDEISIKDAVKLITDAFNFKGDVIVSLFYWYFF